MADAQRQDQWYIHAAFYVIIAVLVYVLIQVAIVEPKEIVAIEKYNKNEARLRMKNLKEAELLYFKKNNRFTNNIDTLLAFVKTSPFVDSVINGFDSMLNRSSNPFVKLSHGEFTIDSLFTTPKSGERFSLSVDSAVSFDTVITPSGKFLRVDTNLVMGQRYRIEDPDGYGYIGDLTNEALKNTASWE